MRLQLDPYDNYDYRSLYRYGTCFAPAGDVFGDACLRLAPDKTNVMLWGDSLAAHYLSGLQSTIDPQLVQHFAGDASGLHADVQRGCARHRFLPQSLTSKWMRSFANHKPDLVIISADWMEYSRPPRFDGMIADLKQDTCKTEWSGN